LNSRGLIAKGKKGMVGEREGGEGCPLQLLTLYPAVEGRTGRRGRKGS